MRSHKIAAPVVEAGRYAVFAGMESAGAVNRLVSLSLTPRVFSTTGVGGVKRVAIAFSLGRATTVTVRVYNRAGRLVRVVLRDEGMGAGPNVAWWDGADASGAPVSDGLYLVNVEAGGRVLTKPLAVVR